MKGHMAQVENLAPIGDKINFLKLPGIRWIIAGIVVLVLTTMWPIFFHWGIKIPKTLSARLGGTLGTLALFFGVMVFIRTLRLKYLLKPLTLITINLWKTLLVFFLVVGIILGNGVIGAVREFLFFWMLTEFMIAGADDRFWYAIEKPLTVVFYTAVPLILVYYQTPMLIIDPQGVFYSNLAEIGGRFTWSLAYDLRPMIASGIFLGIWGFVRPAGGPWRIAQILAPVFFFIIEVGLFQFRSVAFSLALMVLSLLLLRPFLEVRNRPKSTVMLLAICIAALLMFVDTDQYDVFRKRTFEQTQDVPILQSRLDELSAYTADMGWEILIGRGLGGSFDASGVFFRRDTSDDWRTLHFGIMVFTLKGGISMLLLFLIFIGRGFKIYPKPWYKNPCNITAALFFPVFIFHIIMAPILINPVGLFKFIPAMMVLSRFARRSDVVG
jgi:hypothetical protein